MMQSQPSHGHAKATNSSLPRSHQGHHCILAMVIVWAPSHYILAMTIAWPPSHPGHGHVKVTMVIVWPSSHPGYGHGHHLIPDMTTISIPFWPWPPQP